MGLYLVESFKGANIFTKLGFIFLFFAMGFGWVAYCTPSWGRVFPQPSSDYYVGYGVWRYADNQYWNSAPTALTGNHAPLPVVLHTDGWLLQWYGAFQAFATFGFISLNVGFFLIILFMFVAPCKCNSDLGFWNAINNIFGCICWLVAVITFGSQFNKTCDQYDYYDPTVHYSFGFSIITFLLQLVAGIVLLLTSKGGGAVQSK